MDNELSSFYKLNGKRIKSNLNYRDIILDLGGKWVNP